LLAGRILIPSKMEAGSEGLSGWLAGVNDAHPLLVCLALFMLSSAALHYWRVRARAALAGEPSAESLPEGGTPPWVRPATVLGVAILAALFLRFELAEVCRVDGPSMVPTLEAGDRVLVDKLAYGVKIPFASRRIAARVPRRGEVIVFPLPTEGAGSVATKSVVKRVLGLPGDYVAFQGGHPIINNWVVPSCDAGPFATAVGPLFIKGRLSVEFLEGTAYLTVLTPLAEPFAGYRVLPGEVFVIGDDRGRSSDSRLWHEGHGAGVPISSIAGRVTRIVAGGRGEGQVDLAQFLAPLVPKLREAGLDLGQTEERIAACLKNAPAATTPPSPNG